MAGLGTTRRPSDHQTSRTQGNVELLVPTDYTQWQRSGLPSRRKAPTGEAEAKHKDADDDKTKSQSALSVVGPRPSETTVRRVHHHYKGPACPHGNTSKSKSSLVEESDTRSKEKPRETKVLELLIQTRRKALANYKARQEALLEENSKLRKGIEESEKEVHDKVKSLLQRYERFRGAVSTLSAKFETEKSLARKAYQDTEAKMSKELKVLEKQVGIVEEKLADKKKELSVLLSYKDKEYPVRAMKITDLQKQIQYLSDEYQSEIANLENVTAIEKDNYHQTSAERLHNITAMVTDDAIESMHESLKDMAMQNIVMSKEIDDHRQLLVELETTNRDLSEKVAVMKTDPKTNARQVMFPHLFKETPKCTPDMDVVLDIPVQEWLPV